VGNVSQRPSPTELGQIRYNSELSTFEGYGPGSSWGSLGGVRSVDGLTQITPESAPGASDDILRFYAADIDNVTSKLVMTVNNQSVIILNDTQSTDKDTGALIVEGGVGIEKNLNVGGTLAVTGNTTLTADLAVNGGDITTDQTTFNLLNTTATTVNFAGAATTLEIGAATGTTNVNNDLNVDGDVTIDGSDLIVSTTTFNLANTTATTVNFAGDGTNITIGAVTGTTQVRNNLNVSGDIDASGDVDIDGSLFVETNLDVNGNVTLGNATTDAHSINGTLIITAPDNTAAAIQIRENSQPYFTIVTTDGSESVTFESAPRVLINNDSNSTNKDTGALVIEGGVGIEKNLNVGLNLGIDGDLAVNGGDLTTTATTFNLINATATTVNFAGAATTVEIGAATGTTNINNDLDVDGDINFDGGDITSSAVTVNILPLTSTTVNAFGAATALNLGATTGITRVKNNLEVDLDTVLNGTLQVDLNATIIGDLEVRGGDLTTNQTTFNLLNSIATIVNAFGSSTDVNVGINAVTASTLTYGPAVTGNTFKLSSVSSGTVNYTTDVTSGTANILTSVTGTTNLASSGTINLGNSSGETTLVDIGGAITGNQLKISGTTDGVVTLTSDVTTGTVNLFGNVTTGTLNVATAGASILNLGGPGSTVNIKELTLTTDLEVQYGGTGRGTFTENGVIYGNTTDGLLVTAESNPGSNATTSFGILTTDINNVPVWTDVIDGGSY
jgi:hypothetical protein